MFKHAKTVRFSRSDKTKSSKSLSTVCQLKWFCDSNVKTPKEVDRSKNHESNIHENGLGDSVEEDVAKACDKIAMTDVVLKSNRVLTIYIT